MTVKRYEQSIDWGSSEDEIRPAMLENESGEWSKYNETVKQVCDYVHETLSPLLPEMNLHSGDPIYNAKRAVENAIAERDAAQAELADAVALLRRWQDKAPWHFDDRSFVNEHNDTLSFLATIDAEEKKLAEARDN